MKKETEFTFGRAALYLGIGIIVYVIIRTVFEARGWL